ncbi:MAG: heavy metal translocating P-type ATPase metal-binding domain-containing protein [Gemmatimonadota bacterium]
MTSSLAEPIALGTASCTHCGLRVPSGLVRLEREHQFCCAGCGSAWQIVQGAGLGAYYGFAERRDLKVEPSGRGYEELDHAAFESLYVTAGPDGLKRTELYLDGVHCASCVWLVERVPLAVPGAVSAELNVGRSLATVRWDPNQTSLSAIAAFLDRLGYQAHPFRGARADRLRRAEDRAMLIRIGIAGAIAANVMTLALALYAGWFGAMDPSDTRYFRWWSLALTVPAVFWPGRVFFRSAWGALRIGRLHMDVPIALALGAGFTRGAINTISDTGPIYFDGVATLIFLLLVGRFLQQRAQRAAADSAELLYGLTPSTARLVGSDGVIREVPIEALLPPAEVEVRPGETIPADGVVTTGVSAVNVSLLTGESRPVSSERGSQVYAGTVNLSGVLRVRVSVAGEESRLGRMLREVETGARRRAPVVRAADRLAAGFVVVVLILAGVTWLAWQQRDPAVALDHAIALLIVTCPCALALATPLSMTAAIGRAARTGVLIRGADALEALAHPGRLILDKTGTITEGHAALAEWIGPSWVEPLVLALEQHSMHPVAQGFRDAWSGSEAPLHAVSDETIGGGITGRVGDWVVAVGSPAFIAARARDPEGLAMRLEGRLTPVLVAVDGTVVGAAGFGDRIRAESPGAIDRLRRRGWTVEILSGDAPAAVAAVAKTLGIPDAAARGGMTPEGKVDRVEAALEDGPVVMVGDGVNDAAAMARSTVGIGVKGGAEACLAAADVFLARPGLGPLVDLIEGSERTLRVIRRTLALSLAYNLVGATLAVTGIINPLIAAIMMPVSSLTVVLVAWRSRTFREAA